jgi:inner membrane protein
MDNICHSLAGAAIAQAGFARRLPRATLLAVVAANIPDVDAFAYVLGDPAFAVSFRRGWTHGLPALAVWIALLAAGFASWQRARPRAASATGGEPGAVGAKAYLPLAAIAVFSHPALDWMNTYGVRVLMPFSDRWFYGDTLFIVDLALIASFAAGWFLSRRALRAGSPRAERPARVALAVAVAYLVAMKGMSAATLATVRAQLAPATPGPRGAMVAPRPVSLLTRDVLIRRDSTYDHHTARFTLHGPDLSPLEAQTPIGDEAALRPAVAATVDGERFLRWSRFPYYARLGVTPPAAFVGDVRYASGTDESWAGIRVPLAAPGGSGGR